jgi:hypothetical protein
MPSSSLQHILNGSTVGAARKVLNERISQGAQPLSVVDSTLAALRTFKTLQVASAAPAQHTCFRSSVPVRLSAARPDELLQYPDTTEIEAISITVPKLGGHVWRAVNVQIGDDAEFFSLIANVTTSTGDSLSDLGFVDLPRRTSLRTLRRGVIRVCAIPPASNDSASSTNETGDLELGSVGFYVRLADGTLKRYKQWPADGLADGFASALVLQVPGGAQESSKAVP